MVVPDVKTIALALQGGGSHAAFTWGVLDRLLDEVSAGRLRISAFSGTSGGALNAAVCVYGLSQTVDEAKRLLKELWDKVSDESLWPVNPYGILFGKNQPSRWNVDWSPTAIALGMAEQIYSPYLNPWFANPIGPLVEQVIVDFDRLNQPTSDIPKLFVCATDVNRTALRIFRLGEITPEALMASACYPTLFRAVHIDGSFYWDGGYMGNPALNPLLDWADDLLTVLIDPLDVASGPPITARQIVNRINEVSFGSSWVLEMRMIELINELLAKGHLVGGKYRTKRFHVIRDDGFMEQIGAASKLNPSRDFIYELHAVGKKVADTWIQENFEKIGVSSSFDANEQVALRLARSGDLR